MRRRRGERAISSVRIVGQCCLGFRAYLSVRNARTVLIRRGALTEEFEFTVAEGVAE